MKHCELCKNPAMVYCESDQASLCWGCDKKVHEANFLVAKHMRSLLCHACHSPTPWCGSGLKLMPAVSVCGGCAVGCDRAESRTEHGEGDGGHNGNDQSGEDDEEHANGDEDDGESQVVPSVSSSPRHPISRSPSSDDQESSNHFSDDGEETISMISRKRQRDRTNKEGDGRSSIRSTNQLVSSSSFHLSSSKGRRREQRVDETIQS